MLKTLEICVLDPPGSQKSGLGRFFDAPRPSLKPSRVSIPIIRVAPGCPKGVPGAPRDPPGSSRGPPWELSGGVFKISGFDLHLEHPPEAPKAPPRHPPRAPGTSKIVETGVQDCLFNTQILNTLSLWSGFCSWTCWPTRSPWGGAAPPPDPPSKQVFKIACSTPKS